LSKLYADLVRTEESRFADPILGWPGGCCNGSRKRRQARTRGVWVMLSWPSRTGCINAMALPHCA
jgi:hypothetical protein